MHLTDKDTEKAKNTMKLKVYSNFRSIQDPITSNILQAEFRGFRIE